MADTMTNYGQSMLNMAKGNLPFLTGTMRAMLCSSGYTPDQDGHAFKSSVTGEIVTTSTTLAAAASAAASTISTAASIPVGTLLQVNAADVRTVTAVAGTGPYTLTLDVPLSLPAGSGSGVVANPGYTARGLALVNKTAAYDAPTNRTTLDCDDCTWTGSIKARYIVLYCDTGTDATSALLSWVDFGVDKQSSGGPFTCVWNASGIWTGVV